MLLLLTDSFLIFFVVAPTVYYLEIGTVHALASGCQLMVKILSFRGNSTTEESGKKGCLAWRVEYFETR
jgi:hypothetical protein